MSHTANTTDLDELIRKELYLPAQASREATVLAAELFDIGQADDADTANNEQRHYELFSDVADIRYSVLGLAQLVDGIREVLSTCCKALNFDAVDALNILDSLNGFARSLQASSRYESEFKQAPVKQFNVTAYYLAHSRREVLEERKSRGGSERWKLLCYDCYRATRLGLYSSVATQSAVGLSKEATLNEIIEAVGKVDSQAMSFTRAVEVFLKHVPLREYRVVTPELLSALINRTIRTIGKEAEGYSREDGSSVDRYAIWNQNLLAGKLYLRDRRGKIGGTSEPGKLEQEQSKELTTPVHENPSGGVITTTSEATDDASEAAEWSAEEAERLWKQEVEVELEEGASRHEFQPTPTEAEKLSLRAGMVRRNLLSRPSGRVAVWDSSVLTQESLAIIIAQLINETPFDEMSPLQLGLVAFVVTQIHFGYSADRLTQAVLDDSLSHIKASPEETPDESEPVIAPPLPSLVYDVTRGAFTIRPQGHDLAPISGRVEVERAAPYLLGAHKLTISAPRLVQCLLDRFIKAAPRSGAKLFTFLGVDGRTVTIDKNLIDERLKSFKQLIGERLDSNKVGRSAGLHLAAYGETKRGHLIDPLIVAYISGYVPRQLAAQSHYNNLAVSRIEEDFLHASQVAFLRLRKTYQKQVAVRKLADLSCLDVLEAEQPSFAQKTTTVEERFGSPLVPDLEATACYLRELCRGLVSDDRYLRFNRLTAFVTLVVMYVTGMRPLEVASITRARIWLLGSEGEALLAVESKKNKVHKEWRAVLLLQPYGKLLQSYYDEAKDLIELRPRPGANPRTMEQERGESFFFFLVGKSGRVVPFKTEPFRRLLRDDDGGTLGTAPFLWNLNAPRQLFATTAAELAVPRPLIDALLGHVTRGREPLGRFSLMCLGDIRGAAHKVGILIATRLGIDLEPALNLKKL